MYCILKCEIRCYRNIGSLIVAERGFKWQRMHSLTHIHTHIYTYMYMYIYLFVFLCPCFCMFRYVYIFLYISKWASYVLNNAFSLYDKTSNIICQNVTVNLKIILSIFLTHSSFHLATRLITNYLQAKFHFLHYSKALWVVGHTSKESTGSISLWSFVYL